MRAERLELRKGYLGLKLPQAVRALTRAVAHDCSMQPSMGRPVVGRGSLAGGSLWGSFKSQYFSGVLNKKYIQFIQYRYFWGGPYKKNLFIIVLLMGPYKKEHPLLSYFSKVFNTKKHIHNHYIFLGVLIKKYTRKYHCVFKQCYKVTSWKGIKRLSTYFMNFKSFSSDSQQKNFPLYSAMNSAFPGTIASYL